MRFTILILRLGNFNFLEIFKTISSFELYKDYHELLEISTDHRIHGNILYLR